MLKANSNLKTSNSLKVSYVVVLLCAAVLYIATCTPGPVWQDSGMIQYRVWHNDIEGRLGLALSHPLFYIINIGAKYIPLGEFGYRINIVTAILSAVAVANLFLFLRLWLRSVLPALVGALTLGLAHTFWRHATIPETYNLAAALLLCELIMLLQYAKSRRVGFLYLLGLVNGLAIANHMLASIAFICYVVLTVVLAIKKQIRVRDIAVMALLWAIGALPYEYLIVKNILETGDFWATLASAAFGRSFQADVLNTSLSARIAKENLMWITLNFPTPNILLIFAGIWGLYKIAPKRWFANFLLALMILFFIFAFRYTIVDRYAFFIPFYCMVSILIGLGTHCFIVLKNRKILTYTAIILTLLPIPAYVAAPKIAKEMGIKSGRGREIPYRDDYTYFLQPWRTGYRGAERFANEALDTVEDEAIIYADGTTVYALLYIQEIKGKRSDVTIVSGHGSVNNLKEYNEDVIDKVLTERAVYVVSPVEGYCPWFLLEQYKFRKTGVLWKVVN